MSANTVKEEEIEEQILQAAKQLFQLHGFRRVTIDDVAKAIGKARSSLYYYYKTKEELLEAVVAMEIGEMLAAVNKAVGKATTAEQKIQAFFVTKLQVLKERRASFGMLDEGMDASEMSSFKKSRYALHQRVMEQETVLLRQLLTDGIATGELARLRPKELDLLVFVLLSSIRGLKNEMVLSNDFSGIEPAVQMLTRSVIHGLKK